jgi:hypothetical protein
MDLQIARRLGRGILRVFFTSRAQRSEAVKTDPLGYFRKLGVIP